MTMHVRDSGAWKPVTPYIRDAGVWKKIQQGFVKDGGVWKQFYSGELRIGDSYQGGFFGAVVDYLDGRVFQLVLSPKDTGAASRPWKTTNTQTSGGFSEIDGFANTALLSVSTHPAAAFCRSLTIGGFTDWYLPAKYELAALYQSLKPTTGANTTDFGANPYSVPPRASNYTASYPAQTTLVDFQSTGTNWIDTGAKWSSTEAADRPFSMSFTSGAVLALSRTDDRDIRAIRRVLVTA